jgi:hypothetical protein
MKPRGAVESFLVVAALSGLAFGALWKVFTGEPAAVSTFTGLIFGGIVAAITVGKFTEISKWVAVANRDLFAEALEARLAELGFFVKTKLPTYRLYESVSEGTLTLGPLSTNGLVKKVRISFDQKGVTVVGPRAVLDELGL